MRICPKIYFIIVLLCTQASIVNAMPSKVWQSEKTKSELIADLKTISDSYGTCALNKAREYIKSGDDPITLASLAVRQCSDIRTLYKVMLGKLSYASNFEMIKVLSNNDFENIIENAVKENDRRLCDDIAEYLIKNREH